MATFGQIFDAKNEHGGAFYVLPELKNEQTISFSKNPYLRFSPQKIEKRRTSLSSIFDLQLRRMKNPPPSIFGFEDASLRSHSARSAVIRVV